MSKNSKKVLPKLRLSEFNNYPKWNVIKFGNVSKPVKEKAGTKKYTLMSVTSGEGLVPQIEKFGREIAGNSYNNYYVIKKNDFAYNKSATKLFPEGYISMLSDYDEAALPNSIFTCFRITDDECEPRFFDHLFHNNYHGKWLRKFIEVGARAHGALSVDTKHLWDMPIALPEVEEQKKIADCLSSLDDLISSEDKKLKALMRHKKGLMQKLFPAEGETVPELRFLEFVDSDEWESKLISEISNNIVAGGTPSTAEPLYWNGDIRWMNSGELNQKRVLDVAGRITELGLNKSSTKLLPSKCVLIGLAGQGKTRGTVAINIIETCINQSIAAIFPNKEVYDSFFLYHYLDKEYLNLRKISSGDGDRGGLNLKLIRSYKVYLPNLLEEQQKIADCLSSIDDLINAQKEKVETLKVLKKGLIQGLYPSVEEVIQ